MNPWTDKFDEVLRAGCPLAPAEGEIDPDLPLVQLGVDSLAVLGLIVAMEDAFDIVIPPFLLTTETLATPETLWRLVQQCHSEHR